tara:strand:+ start:231 stop:602 length:372 start_codon:yes stop_codon:yes gene_type:complete
MPLFCILRKKKSVNPDGKDIEVLKVGFNYYAFLFTFIWCLSYNLKDKAIASILTLLILFTLLNFNLINFIVFLFGIFIISLFWGFFANDILITNLIEKENMIPTKLIFSDSLKNVLLSYLSEK